MKEIKKILTPFAVAGNLMFVLWMFYNGMDEGWKATPMQLISYLGLTGLLAVNTFLILGKRPKQSDSSRVIE